jgi:WD40 repeat protein
VVVSGGNTDRTIRAWDLASGEPVADPIEVPGFVGGIAVAELDGHPVVLAGVDDGTIRVWSLGQ